MSIDGGNTSEPSITSHGHATNELALQALIHRIEHPRALAISYEERAAVHKAAERAAFLLRGQPEGLLTVALAGCTGSGKSTLINALAGSVIAEADERRPCTVRATVYHHRDIPRGGLPLELAKQVDYVSHDRPELRFKVIIDTPDLDTILTQNRTAAKALLKAAGLIIYVVTPERYLEERVWSVLREEQLFSTCLMVLNKIDKVPRPDLRAISDDIHRQFAEMGRTDTRVLQTVATQHVPPIDGTLSTPADKVPDELQLLRAHIEEELQHGDIVQMNREQKVQAVAYLQDRVERIVPSRFAAQLDALETAARERGEAAARCLVTELADRLEAVEMKLKPLATLRRHEQFFGPLRIWLVASDFFNYGLFRLLLRLRGDSVHSVNIDKIIATGKTEAAENLLKGEAHNLQNTCYKSGLPVEYWQSITSGCRGARLLADLSVGIRDWFEATTASVGARGRQVIIAASIMGILIPLGMVVYALYLLIHDLGGQPYEQGFHMLGTVIAVTFLLCIVLHALVAVVFAAIDRYTTSGIGRYLVRRVVNQTLAKWVTDYRGAIEADVADLRGALSTLHSE